MENRTMRLILIAMTALFLAGPAMAADPAAARAHQAEGDRLRAQGRFEAALLEYQAQLAVGGPSAEAWKRIGWTLRSLHRTPEAVEALRKATEIDPKDREALDDLTALERASGLAARAWLGGTEPGTSKQAVEGQLRYAGLKRLELQAGGGWSDNIFYESAKGYATGYYFYAPGSYLKGDLSLRRYRYTGASRPMPDSNAYDLVPRVELEVSHRFGQVVRGALAYQLFAPNFFYDKKTRIVNHKATAELELTLGQGFSVSGMAAVLVDPDPKETTIKDRPLPSVPPGTVTCVAGVPQTGCATRTDVVMRKEFLVGGGATYRTEPFTASVRVIPNRDLDSGYAWSVLSGLELRPVERLSFDLQWILDRYASTSGPIFAGHLGNIYWARARYEITPALALGGGLKYVDNPSPASTSPTAGRRSDATLLLDLEWRTGLLH
jgi:tetratricopeptide (TPR) repeat protein